jgi:nicotinamidase-related amidase
MKNCLILVDIQNDYFHGGNMELVGMKEAAANAQTLLTQFRKAKLPVIHVQHVSARPDATFFLPETPGAQIHAAVAPQEGEVVVVKHFPNSFRFTSLQEILKQQQTYDLVICGAMSHMCVDSTTRAAFDLGFTCTVADDACATKDLMYKNKTIKAADVHASFMAALSVPFARIVPTRDVIKDLP